MTDPGSPSKPSDTHGSPSDVVRASTRDPAALTGGWLLIVTALATAVMVAARVSADADQPTFVESLNAIASNKTPYLLSGVGRLVSGLTLIAGAWLLARTWIIKERLGTPLVPALFGLSGVFTAVSGALAIALASLASDLVPSGALSPRFGTAETTEYLRWLSGSIGFAIAGLTLIVASPHQWRVGGPLRFVAPVSAVLGGSMQFIWVDSATPAHRIIGPAFVVWLITVGAMLVTGRTEQLFTRHQRRQP